MDTVINNSIGYINDVNNFAEAVDERDVFADLDDDPPGLDLHSADKHISRHSLIRYIKRRLGILTQLAIGTLAGGAVGIYVWEIDESGTCTRNQYTCKYGTPA